MIDKYAKQNSIIDIPIPLEGCHTGTTGGIGIANIIDIWFICMQISGLYERIGSMIENAGMAGANIVCLQEAWSKQNYFFV